MHISSQQQVSPVGLTLFCSYSIRHRRLNTLNAAFPWSWYLFIRLCPTPTSFQFPARVPVYVLARGPSLRSSASRQQKLLESSFVGALEISEVQRGSEEITQWVKMLAVEAW